MEGWYNVKEFGATGDGQTDDTDSIKKTVKAAGRSVVYFPPGTYRVSSTITVTDKDYFGCSLVGANAQAVHIIPLPSLKNKDSIFVFRGGSGAFSNVGIKNMTISGVNNVNDTATRCVGIYIDGQCFATFENVRLKRLKYGIWLHNQSNKAYSELNQFHQIELSFCENGIRLEQGGGAHSFHGNDFNNCYINVEAGQIGFNHVSGFFYNARFRLFMWAHSTEAVYVNADGNGVDNIGDITYESFKPGKFTGSGRFWFSGFIRGRGKPNNGINDQTTPQRPWEKVIACDNYWKSVPYANTDMKAGPISSHNKSLHGPLGFFQSLTKRNVESVLVNTYSGSSENGFYLGRSGYQKDETEAELGLFLSGRGDKIKSYYERPLSLENAKGINFRIGESKGFKLLAGQTVVGGGGNKYKWKDILPFQHMIAGRLFILDQEDDPKLITLLDIVWNKGTGEIKLVSEVLHKQYDRHEHLRARIRSDNPSTLEVGFNIQSDILLHWYFQGLIL